MGYELQQPSPRDTPTSESGQGVTCDVEVGGEVPDRGHRQFEAFTPK